MFDRTEIITGSPGTLRLAESTVCVFGLGGVGAAAAMDLVRAGIGKLVVVDFDTVQESNLNRLYFGYRSAIGKKKTDAFAEYAKNINPNVDIEAHNALLSSLPEAQEPGGTEDSKKMYAGNIPEGCDFYLDCIDTLASKVAVIASLLEQGLPFASSMGMAGRIRPELVKTGSIWKTKGCPLAQRVRSRLRRLGFSEDAKRKRTGSEAGPSDGSRTADFVCVWSDEAPVKPRSSGLTGTTDSHGARVRAEQGSAPFVPQTAGHVMASICFRRLLGL